MQLTVTSFVSLDGVMQGPGGREEDPSGGFDLGGWVVPFVDEDMGALINDWFSAADAFLLGRRTYEIFAGFWPGVTDAADPVATALNSLPKYVPSTTLTALDWNNSELIAGDVPAAVAELKRQPGRELQVHGSAGLLQTLIRHDLVDEFRLLTYPVVLGKGKRLFGDGAVPRGLRLVGTTTTGSGVTAATYRSAGALQQGEIPPPE